MLLIKVRYTEEKFPSQVIHGIRGVTQTILLCNVDQVITELVRDTSDKDFQHEFFTCCTGIEPVSSVLRTFVESIKKPLCQYRDNVIVVCYDLDRY